MNPVSTIGKAAKYAAIAAAAALALGALIAVYRATKRKFRACCPCMRSKNSGETQKLNVDLEEQRCSGCNRALDTSAFVFTDKILCQKCAMIA
jgi:hypothetical protein